MKKKHVYVIAPLIGLIIFAAFYWNFRAGYDRHQEEIAIKARHDREEAIRQQNRTREKAVQMALKEQEQRKVDREKREAEEAKRRDDRAAAYQARDQAAIVAQQNHDKADRLEKDVATTKEQIAKIRQDEKFLRADLANIEEYVRRAQANVQGLTGVTDKIAKADAAEVTYHNAVTAALANLKKKS